MLFINLKANLGNNLFQYSFLRQVAEKHHQPCYLSGDFFQLVKYFDADFRLVRSIFELLICKVLRQKVNIIQPKKSPVEPGILLEEMLNIPDLNLDRTENYVLDGWFQYHCYTSISYFSYKRKYLNQVSRYLAHHIGDPDQCCCIHLRYRDYFTTDPQKTDQYGWVLPINYYQNAVEMLHATIDRLKFIVVSDDIELARQTMFWLPEGAHFSTLKHPILDMILISTCKYKIISNSTFSWWGAKLSPQEATVLCPDYLFRSGKKVKVSSGVYPKDWIRIGFADRYSASEISMYDQHLQHLRLKNLTKKASIKWRISDKFRRSFRSALKPALHLI